jgi:ADP-heptose:LPS heptosyltransferase
VNRRRLLVALQISARRPRQRWSATKFAGLARRLTLELDSDVLLLWCPGANDAATHPGDDAKARVVRELCADFTIFPCMTRTLPELIALLSLADIVVSSDGGATHLAGACGRPVVALFGDANPALWHPWCIKYCIVRAGTRTHVENIEVRQVFDSIVAMIDKRQPLTKEPSTPFEYPSSNAIAI